MADSIIYDDSELQDYLKRLADLLRGTQAYRDIALQAGRKTGVYAESLVGEYPEQPRRPLNAYYPRTHVNTTDKPRPTDGQTYLSKWASQSQAGYFFANLADGGITVPYKRSGRLGASLASEATVTSEGVEIEIGTPLGYAPLVIGNADEQSFYHATTGWTPLEDQMDTNAAALLGYFADAFTEGLEDYLVGG